MTARRAAMTVGSALVRAVAAVAAGIVLAFGIALVLWAITPTAGDQAGSALSGAAVAFASAHFLPVSIASVPVTIHPLLATGLIIAVIATAAGRAPAVRGRALEAMHCGVFVATYTGGVVGVVQWTASPGTVAVSAWPPLVIAALGAFLALIWHPSAWLAWWRGAVAAWVHTGLRAAAVAVLALLAAGAVVLTAALILSFPQFIGVADMTVDSPGAAAGMTLLCLALLPNAVVAAMGYSTGLGFDIGAAHFSPFAVQGADLPGVPLLAAAPSAQPGVGSWLVLACPVVAAAVAATVVVRTHPGRIERLAASGVAGLVGGVIVVGLAIAAGGGVTGGPWAVSGAAPWATGGAIAATTVIVVGIFSVVVRAADGWGRLSAPWVTAGRDADARHRDAAAASASDRGAAMAGAAD